MKYFLDCGAHEGESTRLFRAKYPGARDYEVHLFEPHPELAANLIFPSELQRVSVHPVAVWTRDETLPLWKHERSEHTEGDSLDFSMRAMSGNSNLVHAIDFSAFVQALPGPIDSIILKLDIEGAEYEVLEHMIATRAIDFIDKLYIEWHQFYRPSTCSRARHEALRAELYKRGLHDHFWDARGPDARIYDL